MSSGWNAHQPVGSVHAWLPWFILCDLHPNCLSVTSPSRFSSIPILHQCF